MFVKRAGFIDIRGMLLYIEKAFLTYHIHLTEPVTLMAMSRKAKRYLIILSIPIVLIVGSVAALKLFFTSERLKAMVIPKMEETLRRPVAIKDISLSVLPSLAVELDSATIGNADGPGFSATPMVSLDRVVLKVRLMPLFKGNLEITTMVVERPRMLIETNAQGVANVTGLMQPPSPPQGQVSHAQADTQVHPTSTAPPAVSSGFLLSNFQIVDGTVESVNRKNNTAVRIEGLNHTMRMEVVPVVGDITLEAQTSIERFSYGPPSEPLMSNLRMTLDQQLVYTKAHDLLTIQKGAFSLQDMALTVSGTVANVTTVPVLDLAIAADNLNIAELLSIVPKEYLRQADGLKGDGTAQVRLVIRGEVGDSTIPDVTGQIAAANASIQYAQLPKPITNITVRAGFARTATRQEFVIEKLTASLGDNPIAATLKVVNFDSPTLQMSVNALLNLSDVKDYYPLEKGTELSGTLTANLALDGKTNNPAGMKASGLMEFRNVSMRSSASRNPVRNLQGTISFTNQMIEAKRISLTLGRSDLSLAFWMRNYLSVLSKEPSSPRPVASLSLASNHLYTADIMADTATPPPTPQSSQKSQSPAPQGGARSQSAGQEKPRQSGMLLPDVTMDIAASIGTLTMERFEFKNVRASMRVADGVMTLQNATMDAFEGSLSTRGTINVQKPESPRFDLSLDVNAVEAHTMLPKFTSFGERVFGRLSMTTAMKGTLNDTMGLVPSTLNGQGQVQMGNGRLTGVKVNKVVADMLKLPDLETIAFKDWANAFTVADGRIQIKDLKISALDADYIVNGSQGLDGSLDYSMSLLLPEKTSARVNIPGFAGQAINLFKEPSGRVKLDFTVRGTTDDPSVTLDTRAAQSKAQELVKQRAAEEAKKLQDQAKKKGEGLLKDIFKRKK